MKLKKIDAPDNWKGMPRHEYAELVEFGIGIDLDDLAAHMMRNGYDESEPVVLFLLNDRYCVLDGRNRIEAAKKAEVLPNFREFVGTEAEALEFVHKKILRQHLTASQRAMVAAKIATNQRSNEASEEISSPTKTEAAKSMNVSRESVTDAVKVQEKCTPSVQRAVRTSDVSVSDAAAIANKPKAIQDKALEAVRAGKAKTLKAAADKLDKPKPPKDESGLPKSVQNALADTWHAECAQIMSKMAKQCKAAFSWSAWLDKDVLEHLSSAEQCFLAAVPKKPCPDCAGKKCNNCRQSGYLTVHQ